MVATLATSQNQFFFFKHFCTSSFFWGQNYEIFATIGKRNLVNYWIPTPHWWTDPKQEAPRF